jgi:transcriptional antiterminator NusG
MEMTDETWHLVKSTPKVTGFIGGSAMRPDADLREGSAEHHAPGAGGRRKAQAEGAVRGGRDGSRHRGPFTDFNGTVEEVNYEKSKIRVSVLIFGRATPVELDFGQVEKA